MRAMPDEDRTVRYVLAFPAPRLPREGAMSSCLPQAAMGLGSTRAVGTAPLPAEVARLEIQHQTGGWCLFRLDGGGGFVGDSWHPTAADAKRTAADEFGLSGDAFEEVRS